MREHKYRAWDNEERKMSQGFKIGNPGWLQYTGLKDKNGKEIYQKDSFDGVFSGCYIDWCDKCYSFELFTNECLACLGDVNWREVVDEIQKGNVEIIGNIYSNPELLENN